MSVSDNQALVTGLAELRRTRVAHPPITEGEDLTTIDEAYGVQDALVTALGRETSGWKIGCTSKMAQEMSQTDEPFYGRMLTASTYANPVVLAMKDFFAPIVEPEIAFRLGKDLAPANAPYDTDAVLDAVAAMFPAIEIVDCRWAGGWPIRILPTVADNGVHGAFIRGDDVANWRSVDRTAIAVTAKVNGEAVTDGVSANALDDPINGLVWLANAATKRGHTLKAGEMITTGNTVKAPIFAKAGDRNEIAFAGLGTLVVTFD